MAFRDFKESEIRAIGGLSDDERRWIPGMGELMELAIEAVPRFKESVNAGRGVRRWWDTAREECMSLREANSEMALGFLLRKGIQTVALDWYQRQQTAVWRDICEVAGSETLAEFYAPLYQGQIAAEVQTGVSFPEGRVIGEDAFLRNRKFGLIESFDQELFDDDRTGQIRQRASKLGISMSVTESVYFASRFLGDARTYMNLSVAASACTTTDYLGATVTGPWQANLYGSGDGNRLATYHILNMGAIKSAYVITLNARDPLGNKIVVDADTLLVSTQDKANADILCAPGMYPATVGQSSAALANNPVLGGTSATAGTSQGAYAGFPGGIMSANPITSWGVKPVCERYLKDWVWALGQKGRGIVFQERTPVEVVEEVQNSGSNFNFGAKRYRVSRRFECDWIAGGQRFWCLGNDGSVTGVQ